MATSSAPHLVLARKWRPENFTDLVGQEHVTRILSQALTNGRIAHAFLFAGIRGVGKTTAARILARCLNCEKGPTSEPCSECAACLEIRQGRSLDVVEIDGATYRKIDDARTIIENLSYRPARDRFKIYIIDEAHQLTDQAFNALLKTLEEPPPHVKFILATTEPQKMPETILSRLQRYDFRRIPLAAIRARLEDLTRREGAEAEASALTLIAREAGGSMRDAERTLETAISIGGGPLKEAEVAQLLGVASRSRIYALVEAILDHDAGAALGIVRELHARGANLETVGRDLLETLRNLSVAKLPGSVTDSPLTDLPDQEAADTRRLAEQPSLRDLMRLFRVMAQAQEEMIRSPYIDLLLEMAVVRMATMAPVVDADELMRAIGAAEKGLPSPAPGPAKDPSASGSGASARRMKVAGEVKAEAPLKRDTSPLNPDERSTQLPELRDFIRQRKAALAGFMEHGADLTLEGDTLTVTPRNDIYVRYLGDNRSSVADLASELYGRRISVAMKSVNGESFQSRGANDRAMNNAAPAKVAESLPQSEIPQPKGVLTEMAEQAQPAAKPNGDRETARKALYNDPVARRIFEEFQGRLVEIREKPPAKGADRR